MKYNVFVTYKKYITQHYTRLLEAEAFKLCPEVPVIFLPWTLAQNGYYASRLTLLLFSVVCNCIMAPIVEESVKVLLLKNMIDKYNVNRKDVNSIPMTLNETYSENDSRTVWETFSLRSFVIYMNSIALGLKLADNTRRILLYSSNKHNYKTFFAVARSFFPIQEICGAINSIAMARWYLRNSHIQKVSDDKGKITGNVKNKLVDRIPKPFAAGLFSSFLSSVVLHSIANLRGMKPIFVWNAKRPWDEVQLQAWNNDYTSLKFSFLQSANSNAATPQQLIFISAMNMLWYIAVVKAILDIIRSYIITEREFSQE